MEAILGAVDLIAVMPGARAIAKLYSDYGTAVDRAVRNQEDRQPATKMLERTSW